MIFFKDGRYLFKGIFAQEKEHLSKGYWNPKRKGGWGGGGGHHAFFKKLQKMSYIVTCFEAF